MLTVLTLGVFDLLHVGHLSYLEQAAQLGQQLIVGVPSDEVVQQDKGQPPVIPLGDRLRMLAALRIVTDVQPYYHLEFLSVLQQVRPQVLAVGGDWGHAERHREAEALCARRGCRVVRLTRYPGESTTAIRQRIRAAG